MAGRSLETEGRIPAIVGMGKAVGRRVMTNTDMDVFLEKKSGTVDRLNSMRNIRIEQRSWVTIGEQETSDLAVEALQEAIAKAGLQKDELTAVWLATSSPDMQGVSTVAIVQTKMGLPHEILGSNNADACPGWIHAAYRAITDMTSPYGRGGKQAAIGVEIISPNLSKKKPLISVLFGDAAGATIFEMVKPDDGAPTNIGFAFGVDGRFADNLGVAAGGSRLPTSAQTVEADQHSIHMDGDIIHEQAVFRMAQVTKRALDNAGLPIEEVDLFIPHQANYDIIVDTAEALSIPMEKVVVTIGKYGNTSAASVPTAMYEAYEKGILRRNQKIAIATFGAGLTFAGAALTMAGLRKR